MAKVQGLSKLMAKLKRLRVEAAPAMKPALGEAATLVVSTQKRLAPVKHGELRESIDWRFDETGGSSGENPLVAIITCNVDYGVFVEHGTAAQAAQPFFYPGYRSERKAARAILQRAATRTVKQIAAS